MITEEEKKIIKRLKDDIALVTFNDNLNYGIGNLYVNINDLKIILNLISKLQSDIEIKDKVIDEIDTYCKHDLAFERRLKKENIEPDLFNQGRFSTCENILKLLEGKDE